MPDYTPDQLEALAHEKADIEKHLAGLGDRLTEIDAIFKGLGEGAHAAGIFKVKVTTPKPSMLVKPALVQTHYPFADHPTLYKVQPDTAKINAAIELGVVDPELVKTPSRPSTKVEVV
ncbi:hypothetical protein [Litorihabitans aurantiacus]|uniref:Uncharacterized protein n=1 Tax=Litorihabitans aurantiacus TaxID=1930061 RepID=A0AA37XEL0_9MICO|nr:hypothetical protein [Litorihabitans aurantiacus]GMA31575.1 hypothetical protein GCM10025875_15670 [Litorihabitans aurantiacus]